MPDHPESIALARRLYEATDLKLNDIAAKADLPLAQLRIASKNGHWRRPLALRRPAPTAPLDRGTLVARLWWVAEKQMREIDQCIASAQNFGEREQGAKLMSHLVRILRDLAQVETAFDNRQADRNKDRSDHDTPRDMDGLRSAVAQRLDRLRAERAAAPVAGEFG